MLFDGQCPPWWQGYVPQETAVIDYEEERLPDDFGEPGKLVAARLVYGVTDSGHPVTPSHRRRRLLVNGSTQRVVSWYRRYLRWQWVEPDPPIDPCYDDPA